MRWLVRIAVGLPAFIMAAIGAGGLWLATSLPRTEGRIALSGLDAPVEVLRDRFGVPHIRAVSEHDAFFTLGFVHAQDRLWQMDFQRRLAAGRLSEILGPTALASDRFMRTLGIYRLAEGTYAQLSAAARAALDSYAAGVNAFLASHEGAWPPEFYLLRYRPEPWRPADSLVWGRLMGLFLSRNWREEALRAALARRLSADRLRVLFPPYPSDGPTTLALPGDPAFGSASNAWVVSGAYSASGKPLLAHDPHLRFRLPGTWYLVRLKAPGLVFAGATAPGVPFPVLGHNGQIAWAFTTAETDVEDLFVERLDPTDPDRYQAPGAPLPFAIRHETIKVRGQEDETLVVRTTRHGPVLSGLDPRLSTIAGPNEVIALASPALAPDDRTPEALYRLSHAGDWESFRAALRDWHAPHQNVLYADRVGRIGYIAPARIPIRKAGDGALPAPGWDGSHDWTGWVPFEALPQALDPAGGRFVNANNRSVPFSYPYALGRNLSSGYRARRIGALLAARSRHDPDSMAAIQMDVVSLSARELLPLMMKSVQPTTEIGRKSLALVATWDGAMDRTRPEPLIFTAWLRETVRLTFADELGEWFPHWWGLRPRSVKAALTGDPRWCDDVTTPAREDCAGRLTAALDIAMAALAKTQGDDPSRWRWGTVHRVRFRHPVLGRIPVIGPLFDVDLAADGGADTLNRGVPDIGNPRHPFASVHGAGYRAVYDLADLDASRVIVTPGQSGNFLSAHYADLARVWRDGGHLALSEDAGADASRLILVPVAGTEWPRPAR